MALRMTMQREEAEDVVQETMIKLWNQRDNLNGVESIEAYAMTICRNQALDHLRKSANTTVSLDAMPNPDAHHSAQTTNPYDKIFADEGIRRINRIMAELPEKQRTCMQLRDFEGKNYREIAQILSITEDQVKVNIFRARKYIKERIKGE